MWDDNNQDWISIGKDEYVNSSTGERLAWMEYSWNESYKEFELGSKWEYSYFPNRKLESELLKVWMPDSAKWRDVYKWEYTFDVNGNDSLLLVFEWVGKYNEWNVLYYEWVNHLREESIYNANNNDSTKTIYNWNIYENVWDYRVKTIVTLNQNDIDRCYEFYNWNKDSMRWIGGSKSETNYLPNGDKTLFISYNWDHTLSNWIESSKYVYTYNTEEKPFEYFGYQYDTIFNDWIYIQNTKFDYDSYENEIMKIDSSLEYSTNLWKDFKILNYYSLPTNIITLEPKINLVRLYPNPVSDFLNIEMPAITVCDGKILNLNGQLIKTFEITQNHNCIDVSYLRNGMYFITIATPHGVVTQKLIKN
jgi:hypothetical protein